MGETISLHSSQLGTVKIDLDKVVTFNEGLIGFEDLRRFAIINLEEYAPFQWLLCIDDPELSFPIISPILVVEDYFPDISRLDANDIGEFEDSDLLLYAIVTIRPDIGKVSANLLGPIIINQKLRLGQQIVLRDEKLSTEQEFMS